MRWYDGTVYRIGELASIANVSKRTIDYYTKLGLLNANRSQNNYRIYSESALQDLKFIEECKSLHYPLEEIKRKLEMKKHADVKKEVVQKQIEAVTQQIIQLQNDLSILKPLIEKSKDENINTLSKVLNNQLKGLMKSLTSF